MRLLGSPCWAMQLQDGSLLSVCYSTIFFECTNSWLLPGGFLATRFLATRSLLIPWVWTVCPVLLRTVCPAAWTGRDNINVLLSIRHQLHWGRTICGCVDRCANAVVCLPQHKPPLIIAFPSHCTSGVKLLSVQKPGVFCSTHRRFRAGPSFHPKTFLGA